jgi:hypothetical protein
LHKEKSPEPHREINWTSVAAIFTALITAWAVWDQAQATRKAAEATRDAAEATQANVEAFCASQGPQLVATAHGDPTKMIFGDTARVNMRIENNGPTTAYDLLERWWIEVLPTGAIDFTDNATTHATEHPTCIYPRQNPVILNIPLGRALTLSEKEDIKHLKRKVCIRLRLTFRDVFRPRRRYTEFGYTLLPDGLGFMDKYNNSGIENDGQDEDKTT